MNNKNNVILSCIDGSSVSAAVSDYACWIAAKIAAPLKLLHSIEQSQNPVVADLSGAIGLGSQEELLNELTELEQNRSRLLIKKGQLMLEAVKARAIKAGIDSPEISQRHGSLSESLVELEDEIRVLVIGIRGEAHEKDQAGIGTQLDTVIRSLHKPILVVNKGFTEPKRVMLAYDGGEACRKALNMVASGPLLKDIPCHIVHVGENGQALMDEAARVLRDVGIEVTTAQLTGEIDDALSQYQSENQIDLTIMGAFSHNRIRDFLVGSFTAKMLAKTNRPLLLLR